MHKEGPIVTTFIWNASSQVDNKNISNYGIWIYHSLQSYILTDKVSVSIIEA